MLTLLVHKLFLLLIKTLRRRMFLLLASMFSVCIGFTREAKPTENTFLSVCYRWRLQEVARVITEG